MNVTSRSRVFSLHFHSVKHQSNTVLWEVAESIEPEFNAIDAIVLYLQSTVIFPSWTSPVRIPRIPEDSNGQFGGAGRGGIACSGGGATRGGNGARTVAGASGGAMLRRCWQS